MLASSAAEYSPGFLPSGRVGPASGDAGGGNATANRLGCGQRTGTDWGPATAALVAFPRAAAKSLRNAASASVLAETGC